MKEEEDDDGRMEHELIDFVAYNMFVCGYPMNIFGPLVSKTTIINY